MRLLALCLLALAATAAAADDSIPTHKEAAGFARWLTRNLNYGSMATVDTSSGFPFAAEEDFAEDGALTGGWRFVLPGMSLSHQNLMANPHGSFSIARENCTCALNCAGMPWDVLVCERYTAVGTFNLLNVTMEWPSTDPDLQNYVKMHPAVADYLQGDSPHTWYLWELVPKTIFYVGGYGSEHAIFSMPLDMYAAATPHVPP